MSSQDVAKTNETGFLVSSEFLDQVSESGDLGYSQKAEDSLIPILGILQDNSGEVKKKHERYIEGCEPGDMIMRSLNKVWKGEGGDDAGLLFQPCAFQHMWVEWSGEPGEGAPVKQYLFEELPAEAKEVQDPEHEDRTILKMPNGNRLVDTRYHYGHIINGDEMLPCVIPMAGSNHTISRQWTAQMKQFKVPGRDQKAPSFFRIYNIQTAFNSRGAQSWFKYRIADRGQIGDESVLRQGFELMKAVGDMDVTADIESDVVSPEKDDIPV